MNKKKLYPVVKAFEVASPAERRRLGDYYFKRVIEPSDARGLSELISQLDVSQAARREIDSRVNRAMKAVEAVLPTGEKTDSLSEFLRKLPGDT